jgi:hypothetical protein
MKAAARAAFLEGAQNKQRVSRVGESFRIFWGEPLAALEDIKTSKLIIKYHRPHKWKLSLRGIKQATQREQDLEKAAQNAGGLPDRNLQLFFIHL